MFETSHDSEPLVDRNRAAFDAGVEFIVGNLGAVTGQNWALPLYKAVTAIRQISLHPGRRNLSARQARSILEALGSAFRAICPAIAPYQRFDVNWGCNAAGTLVLIWRGNDPRWTAGSAAEADARDLTISFEFELLSTIMFRRVQDRNAAAAAARASIIADLAHAPAAGGKDDQR